MASLIRPSTVIIFACTCGETLPRPRCQAGFSATAKMYASPPAYCTSRWSRDSFPATIPISPPSTASRGAVTPATEPFRLAGRAVELPRQHV